MSIRWNGGRYDAFRILLGIYLLIHFVHLLPWGAEVFSNQGMIGSSSASPLFGIIPSPLAISDGPEMVRALLAAGAIASVFLIFGRFDKPAAFLAWYILACLFARNPLILNPALPYLGWMLIAHLFVPTAASPAGATHSTHETEMPREIFFAAWAVLALSYTYSGYTKLLSPTWVSGDAVWCVLHNPLARDYFGRDIMLWLGEDAVRWLTWVILGVETLFAPLALFRRLRPLLWGLMLGAQFGFLFLLNFADLTAPMFLFHLLTFDPAWIGPRPASAASGKYRPALNGSFR